MPWNDEEWNHSGWQSTESDDMKWQIQNLQDHVQNDEKWNHSGWQSTESDDMKWQIQNLQDHVQHLGYP